jgi:solute carrier family 25 (mitochondrial S-adenosylmethionine transporter), member 26
VKLIKLRARQADNAQAGAFAAFTVDLLVYPLDTLKTRIQSPDYTKHYKNANGTTKRALFRGLYQGIGPIVAITIPSSGAFFTTYEGLKFILNEWTPPNSTLYVPQSAIHAVASGGAELVSCAILTPAEVIKQNAQVIDRDSMGRKVSPTAYVFKKFRNRPTQLWRGYTALAARNLPFTALQFPVFEKLKLYFMQRRKDSKGGQPVDGILERASITAASAGIAGSASAWITTPIDVVKTRIMLAASQEEVKPKSGDRNWLLQGASGTRKSGFAVAKDVMQSEGVRGLFRGAALRGGWTALGSALYLGAYEGGRFYLEDARKQKGEGDELMEKKRDWSNVQVGIGSSRSQGDKVRKSAWQDD